MADACFDDMLSDDWDLVGTNRISVKSGAATLEKTRMGSAYGRIHATGKHERHVRVDFKSGVWGSEEAVTGKAFRPLVPLLLGSLMVVLLIGAVLSIARNLPLTGIQRIQVNAKTGSFDVAKHIAADLARQASSWDACSPAMLEKRLEDIALVSHAVARRKPGGLLTVDLDILQPDLILAGLSSEGKIEHMVMVHGDSVLPLDSDYWSIVPPAVGTVQVPSAYAVQVLSHGIDDRIRQWMQLFGSLSGSMGDDFLLVSRITSDVPIGGLSTGLVIHLDRLNAQIWVRDRVDADHVRNAVDFIAQEHQRDDMRNIALRGQLRYDLYLDALVCRI